MIDPGKTVCFTGHRPLQLWGEYPPLTVGGSARTKYDTHQILVMEAIRKCILAGYDTFISGGAQGMDLLAALCVIELKLQYKHIELVIARPFPSQHSNKPESAQEHIRTVEAAADMLVDVSPDPYSPEKMQIRNRYMVDNSTVCIALWDGTQKGGTYNCLRYAMENNKFILVVDPVNYNYRTINSLPIPDVEEQS